MSARKPRCRVGDRCFIIKTDLVGNLGRIVRVVSRSEPADDRPGLWWWCTSEGGPMRGVLSDDSEVTCMSAYAQDSSLLPIRPEAGGEAGAIQKSKPRSGGRRIASSATRTMQPATIGGEA